MKTLIFLAAISGSLSINCLNPSKGNPDVLSFFLETNNPNIFFSFPGRYTESEKKENVRNKIREIIKETKYDLKIYAYSLNDPVLIDDIFEAKKRGVLVKITLDKDKDYSSLRAKNIEYSVWQSSGLHHLKVIVSDELLVFFGTGNFTKYGLTQDHNGYIEFRLEEKNKADFISLLENTFENPVMKTREMFFMSSPKDGRRIQSQITREIERAKKSIHYLIFDHFDPVISHYLKEASFRGLEVVGVYDTPTDEEGIYLKDSFYGLLSGIYRDGNEDKTETESFPEGGLLHHKTMIIDSRKVLTGSYNYSLSARDNNREIFMQIENQDFAAEFEKEFHRIRNKAYREPMNKFYSEKKSMEVVNINKQEEICLSESDMNQPLILLGEGVFRTTLYYPEFFGGNCIEKKSFHSISSNFAYPKTNSLLEIEEFWEDIKIFERNSNRVYQKANPGEKSIFQGTKPLNSMTVDFFDLMDNGNIIFRTNRSDLDLKKATLFFPGDALRHATLRNYSQDQETVFYGHLTPEDPQKKSGVAFIELQDETLFFCFQKNDDSKKSAIVEFLSEWTVFQSISGNQEIQKPSCFFY